MTSDPADGKEPPRPLFEATRWTVVLQARDKSEIALASLCGTYRSPLLTWLRLRGYSSHDAEDLVQGFFAHLLSRDFLRKVSKEKGNFRTFLLRCLKNYLRDQHARESAGKRGGGANMVSLNETREDGHILHDPAATEKSPDLEYDRAWAKTVLDTSLRRLESACIEKGDGALFAELELALHQDHEASPYRAVGERLGMTGEAVKVAAHRTRRKLEETVREEVKRTVANDNDWETEVRYLFRLFGK